MITPHRGRGAQAGEGSRSAPPPPHIILRNASYPDYHIYKAEDMVSNLTFYKFAIENVILIIMISYEHTFIKYHSKITLCNIIVLKN
jgi:hypothetical protein